MDSLLYLRQYVLSQEESEERTAALGEIDAIEIEIALGDGFLLDRSKLLEAMPACVAHGNHCMPHALEWISQVRTLCKVIAGFETPKKPPT